MKKNYLLPSYFKKIGWFLLVPFSILSLLAITESSYFPELNCEQLAIATNFTEAEWLKITNANIAMTITLIGLALSLLFISFSKEKIEDEYISKIREKSLVWAVIFNYIIVCIAVIFLFEFAFMLFSFINMYTILLLFICKFNYELYRFKKSTANEE